MEYASNRNDLRAMRGICFTLFRLQWRSLFAAIRPISGIARRSGYLAAVSASGCGKPSMITLQNVTLRRAGTDVLHRVSLTIPTGSVTAILGRSGAGKTSLICALNGLIAPRAGVIAVAGAGRLDDPRALRDHRRRTATIFQDHALIDRLSAIENVLLGLADARHPLSLLPWPDAMRRRAAMALDEVGLLDRAM